MAAESIGANCSAAASETTDTEVLLFYKYVDLGNQVEALAAWLESLCAELQLTGRALLAREHARFSWQSLAGVQFAFFTLYFFMLRGMGRSYLELSSGEAPPLPVDLAFTLFRAFEPVLGGSCTLIVALAMTDRLGTAAEPPGAPAEKGRKLD